ncbi:hypothetical protein [Streptomyces sp. Root63]|uniref:hypothetical protein n=1 Tax=Streptomyces sp. Root63 TaxID=1736573 RepID=UPI000A576A2F|nr:hypothetical protein [Streptomyces sp. Root63]
MTFENRSDFSSELQKLANKISKNPRLEITSFALGDPLPENSLAEVEERLGANLPDSVRRLYRSLSHATLRWRFRPDLDEQTRITVADEFANAVSRHNLYTTAGSVEILPLEDMLFEEEYNLPSLEFDEEEDGEDFDFCSQKYPTREFERMLRPFDLIDGFFAMALVVQPSNDEWKMMLLNDHWSSYEESRVTYLDDYLAYTAATWGLVNARAEIFGESRGDRRPALRYDPELAASRVPPTLTSPT